jgi:23S rRNA pseudouridine2605 synthase
MNPMKKEMLTRLNRYIAESGVTSRRKSEEFILQGRVTVNNKVIENLAFKVDGELDVVMLDGEKINPRRHIYFLLNKPAGVITSTDDEKKRKTVVDLIKVNEKIFPVGRLDYNTTGVLLLTNDGEFSNFLTHPRNKIPKEYEVKLDKPLSVENLEKLLKGIYIDRKKGVFAKILFQGSNKKSVVVTTFEGRNHFVKRMFSILGYNVTALNRKSFAGFTANVPPGSYRKLSKSEVEGVFKNYAK